jgi:hypothetical protein
MSLGLSESAAGDNTVQFRVTADNRVIYTGNVKSGQSRHVRLNVAGVARLDLATTLMSNSAGSVSAAWGGARLLS